jgi:hypothetical protein
MLRREVWTALGLIVSVIPAQAIKNYSPKGAFGCSGSVAKLPETQACLDQQQKDLLSNSSTQHFLFCDSTGAVSCCVMGSDGNIVNNSCEQVVWPSHSHGNPPPTFGSPNGGNTNHPVPGAPPPPAPKPNGPVGVAPLPGGQNAGGYNGPVSQPVILLHKH